MKNYQVVLAPDFIADLFEPKNQRPYLGLIESIGLDCVRFPQFHLFFHTGIVD